MLVKIFNSYEALSFFVATEWAKLIKEKPDAVVCLASGDSPKLTCDLFCKLVKETNTDTSQFFFVGLDEWAGVSPAIYGSCHNDFQKRLIQPLNMLPSQYHLFNAMSADLKKECSKMDQVIAVKGGIDLMIVGIGMNGHIGFNEPGVDFALKSHVIDLDKTTVTVGQKYFKEDVVLKQGITLGLAHLMACKQVFLVASGEKKAGVIKKAVEGEITNQFPASIMQTHENGFIIIDKDAAIQLSESSLQNSSPLHP